MESVEDYKVPFEESATYKKIEELLDNNFSDYEHDMVFDKEKRELNIYFQAPDNLRAALDRRESGLLDAWQKVVDSMTDFSEKLQTTIQIGGKAEDANIYWVDKLRSGHDYTESDYLVWVRNGTVIYNYADQSPQSSMSSGESKETDDHSADVSNDQDSGREPATFGEKNALEKALQYLKYSAFSYTGLIDQLEFEGFTNSQAEYAVSKFY